MYSHVVYNPEISQIALLACFQYCSMGATYWLCYGLIIIIFLAKLVSIVILNNWMFMILNQKENKIWKK